jgi:general secretion pathway protein N
MNALNRRSSNGLWTWAGVGAVCGGLLALLLCAPASWLAQLLEQASDGRVVLLAPRGTVWDGSAQLLLTGGPGSRDAATLPGRIDWTLRPGWSQFHVQLKAPCCTPEPLLLQVQAQWGGLTLKVQDGASTLPADLLSGLGTPWNTLQPQGSLALSTQGLVLQWAQGRLAVSGQAKLQALGMSSSLSTLKPMGSYQITVLGGPSTTLQLQTIEGSLQLTGSGRWVDGRLHFQGAASAAPEHLDALSNLLNIIGRREGARSIIQVG